MTDRAWDFQGSTPVVSVRDHESVVRERDALRAQVAALREALTVTRGLMRAPGGEVAHYDWLAEEFYRETGIMAPGKSVPLEMGNQWTDQDRAANWTEWMRARHRKAWGMGDAALEATK